MKQKQEVSRSSSRNKVASILREEQEVSNAFRLDNFYHDRRLNIQELKKRLEAFKRRQKQPSPLRKVEFRTQQSPVHSFEEQSTAKFAGLLEPLNEANNETLAHIKKRLNFEETQKGYSQQPSQRKQDSQHNNGSGVWAIDQLGPMQQPEMNRYGSKSKTVYKPHRVINTAAVGSLNSREFLRRDKVKTSEKTEQSRCSDSWQGRSFEQCFFEGKMVVRSQGEVSQLENQIAGLWEHYQLLTRLLVSLRESVQREKPTIVRYIQTVCSRKFQFLRDLLEELMAKSGTKKEIAFTKRLRKAVTLSRLYENLAILYLSLTICLGQKCDSHLSNLIGYSTSSITFTIRLLWLLHELQLPLKLAPQIEDILEAIGSYERASYGGRIGRVSEVTLRTEQNNETIAIVQTKICGQMDRHFQDTIASFLKNVDYDSKAYFQYGHYIFEFLAFELASLGVRGQFGAVEIAPAPYHPPFPKARTLVIEPWEVLFARKGTATTFIRSHTDTFLKLIGQHWNIVYWTDLMPKDVDDLLERLPPGLCLYRYHCKYEQEHFVKQLERVGCDPDNTLIVDRCEDNFRYDGEVGITLPWKGHRRDVKLLELLELLDPLFQKNDPPLRNCLGAIRSKFSAKSKKKGVLLRPVKTVGPEYSSPYESLPKRLTELK